MSAGWCHCGHVVFINDAIEPGFTRGLCEDCDAARCDAYPGACGRADTSVTPPVKGAP